jgi:hypothetical protein
VQRYFSVHTFKSNAFTKENLAQLNQLAVKDSMVTGIRFEGNLNEGKMYCVFEAPDKQSFETWLSKHNVPHDYVVQTSIACEGGTSIREL